MKFAFIAAEKATLLVAVLCKVLDVSRSGFYASQKRGPSARAVKDAKLAVAVAAAHKVGRGAYGSPRILEELKADDVALGRKRIARIMAELGLEGRRRRRSRGRRTRSRTCPSPRTCWTGSSRSTRRTSPG